MAGGERGAAELTLPWLKFFAGADRKRGLRSDADRVFGEIADAAFQTRPACAGQRPGRTPADFEYLTEAWGSRMKVEVRGGRHFVHSSDGLGRLDRAAAMLACAFHERERWRAIADKFMQKSANVD